MFLQGHDIKLPNNLFTEALCMCGNFDALVPRISFCLHTHLPFKVVIDSCVV